MNIQKCSYLCPFYAFFNFPRDHWDGGQTYLCPFFYNLRDNGAHLFGGRLGPCLAGFLRCLGGGFTEQLVYLIHINGRLVYFLPHQTHAVQNVKKQLWIITDFIQYRVDVLNQWNIRGPYSWNINLFNYVHLDLYLWTMNKDCSSWFIIWICGWGTTKVQRNWASMNSNTCDSTVCVLYYLNKSKKYPHWEYQTDTQFPSLTPCFWIWSDELESSARREASWETWSV